MNQRVITCRIQLGCTNHRIPYVKDSIVLQKLYMVELRFLKCACVVN